MICNSADGFRESQVLQICEEDSTSIINACGKRTIVFSSGESKSTKPPGCSVLDEIENIPIKLEAEIDDTSVDNCRLAPDPNSSERAKFMKKVAGRKKILKTRDAKNAILSFMCEKCGQKFTKKYNLQRHEKEIHEKEETMKIMCDKCGRSFCRPDSLTRHLQMMHPQNALAAANSRFECFLCQKKFKWKRNLIVHIQDKHSASTDGEQFYYDCSFCPKKFLRKLQLINHCKRAHDPNIHSGQPSSVRGFKCVKCRLSFYSQDIITKHYEHAHKITMSYEKLQFDSVEKFENWRIEMQRNTITQYTKCNSWKSSECATQRFLCHRSLSSRDRPENKPQKRRTKLIGSKKLSGFCPSTIVVKMRGEKLFVEFQTTHVGHAICSVEELPHMSLDEYQKKEIASKLLNGVPRKEIVNKHHLPAVSSSGVLDRLSILKAKDVYNIAKRIEARQSIAVEDDETPVESYDIQNKESILFFKIAGQNSVQYNLLEEEDTVIVLMNPWQAENVQRHGRNIVALDGSHSISSSNFKLHSMFVIDVNGNGLPVAFLLSNRFDKLVIDIFIRCVRERVGIIKPKTLITDLQPAFYNSWKSCMELPNFYLYCTGQVSKNWQTNLLKISNQEQRKTISQQLHDLRKELDEISFQEKLDEFMSVLNDEAPKFFEYFRSVFHENVKCWAYCYRKHAGINKNVYVELFHREFKRYVGKNKKIGTFYEYLKYLENYMRNTEKKKSTLEFRCNSLTRLDILNQNHLRAKECLANDEIPIIRIDNNTWQIASSIDADDNILEMYVVEKTPRKQCSLFPVICCQLLCRECNICFHEYQCSCFESAVEANMCKHIHVLGIYLQNEGSVEAIVSEEADIVEEDVSVVETVISHESGTPVTFGDSCEENLREIENIKAAMRNSFENALRLAKTEAELQELNEKFVLPIVKSRTSSNRVIWIKNS